MCGCRPHDADSCVKRVRIPPMKDGDESSFGEGRHFSWLPNPHALKDRVNGGNRENSVKSAIPEATDLS